MDSNSHTSNWWWVSWCGLFSGTKPFFLKPLLKSNVDVRLAVTSFDYML